MLEGFTRNIERKIFGVKDTLDEVEVLRDKVFTVVHDEDTMDIQLDVVALRFEEIEGCFDSC